MEHISITKEVLKLLKSNDINELQLKNMRNILVTSDVLNFEKSILIIFPNSLNMHEQLVNKEFHFNVTLLWIFFDPVVSHKKCRFYLICFQKRNQSFI